MTQVSTFLKQHGGPKVVAEKINRKRNAVTVWGSRNRIPRSAWPELIEGLGVDMQDLLAIEGAAS